MLHCFIDTAFCSLIPFAVLYSSSMPPWKSCTDSKIISEMLAFFRLYLLYLVLQ